jgi:Pectate lyase superfamily protein
MQAPQVILGPNGLPVWQCDPGTGNTIQSGTMQSLDLVLDTEASPSTPGPGYVKVYSPDGSTLWSINDVGTETQISPGPDEGGIDWLNVVDFGADKTGVADSTAAIQAALNAVTPDGTVVYFPLGTYKISATLTASVTGTQMMGDGWGSQILYDGTVATTAINSGSAKRIFIRDLRISQTNATNAGTAIDASGFVNGVIERVLIDGGGASGVSPNIGVKMDGSGCFYNELRACRINYGGTSSAGVYIGAGANSNTLLDLRLVPGGDDVNSSGIYITASSVIMLVRPDIEAATGNGIFLDTGAHGCTIIGAYTESNNINLKISSGVKAPTILGGTYQNGTTANVQDNGAIGPIVLNAWPNTGSSSYNHVSLLNTDEFTVNSVPVPGAGFQPSDQNLIAWSYDPTANANSTALATSGVIHLVKVNVRYPTTITNILYQVATEGSGLTTGENFVGLYDSTGTLRGTSADMTATWNTTDGFYTTPLVTPYTAAAGFYYVAFVANGTTGPAVTRGGGLNGSAATLNAGLTAATYRYAVNSTGHTTLPTPLTLSASTEESVGYWVALS